MISAVGVQMILVTFPQKSDLSNSSGRPGNGLHIAQTATEE